MVSSTVRSFHLLAQDRQDGFPGFVGEGGLRNGKRFVHLGQGFGLGGVGYGVNLAAAPADGADDFRVIPLPDAG